MSLDKEPPQHAKDFVRHATWLRGVIVSSYAHVEYLLADILISCNHMQEYNDPAFRYPYSFDSRMKKVGEFFDKPGPLQKYRDEVLKAIAEFDRFSDMRHFMAHGIMIVKGAEIEFRMYRKSPEGDQIGVIETDAGQLGGAAEEITAQCSNLIRLFSKIYLEEGLPNPLEFAHPPIELKS
jgi:hypothetical protein